MKRIKCQESNTGIKDKVIAEIKQSAVKWDIDLAVTGGNAVRFAFEVDEETSTLLKYDVVELDRSVQKELRESIEREGIILYEKVLDMGNEKGYRKNSSSQITEEI